MDADRTAYEAYVDSRVAAMIRALDEFIASRPVADQLVMLRQRPEFAARIEVLVRDYLAVRTDEALH